MIQTPFLKHVFPKNFARYSGLPVFGCVMENFAHWLEGLKYPWRSIRRKIQGTHATDRWLRRQRIATLASVTPEVLVAAEAHFRRRDLNTCHTVQSLHRFLREQHALPAVKPIKGSSSQEEANRFAVYLREVRGLAETTVNGHTLRVIRFLEFIGFNRRRCSLRWLKPDQIERFVRQMAKTQSRFSLRVVGATLRAFLRFEFSHGALPRPLHEQVDMPRVYREERLPCALPREQVRKLLHSIDQTSLTGSRDFTMFYLLALYGLRCGDLVRLRLEDIDWRHGILQVKQAKTRQAFQLPLTDEAGDVLTRYLCKARPCTKRREVFLKAQAPEGPLSAGAVNLALQNRVRRSGLKISKLSPHVLRHSLAVHLLRRGVPMKSIGDTLGHRDVNSTSQYLRLSIDDLRAVGLPAPKPGRAVRLLKGGWEAGFPRVRVQAGHRVASQPGFRSSFGIAIKQYLDTRRTLGRKCVMEENVLRSWDSFLHRREVKTIDSESFCLWAKDSSPMKSTTQYKRMSCVRSFLAYYARKYPRCFVPDTDLFPKTSPPRPPRLVSTSEMARMLATVAQLGDGYANPLRPQTIRLGLLLLFCCGLRAGELLRLQLHHYEAADQLLRIEATKFNKSRLVPLSPSVARFFDRYLQERQRSGAPANSQSSLIWGGSRLDPRDAYTLTGFTSIWQRLCLSAGVVDERGRPPRLHDLRHTFAVTALHRWYEQGVNVQTRLPHLATYLGHISPASSHYYLQLTPALRSAASQRFYRAFGDLAQEGGVS